MKRVASIQDISCLGRCSLTVALPVISAMEVECAILPTAVLSAHTMFPDILCRDENAPWYGVEFEKALRYLPELLER